MAWYHILLPRIYSRKCLQLFFQWMCVYFSCLYDTYLQKCIYLMKNIFILLLFTFDMEQFDRS